MTNKKDTNITINFIIFYESIFQCTPWQNSILLLKEKGFDIAVYQRYFRKRQYNSGKESLIFSLFQIKSNKFFDILLRILSKTFDYLGSLFKNLPRRKIPISP